MSAACQHPLDAPLKVKQIAPAGSVDGSSGRLAWCTLSCGHTALAGNPAALLDCAERDHSSKDGGPKRDGRRLTRLQ